MNIGFLNKDFEEMTNKMFDIYVDVIKSSEPGTKDFNFASQMLRNHLDFMIYNREVHSLECIPQLKEN